MEELLDQLVGSSVSDPLNSSTQSNPRFQLYKNKGNHEQRQKERREKLLRLQKSKRQDAVELLRKAADEDWNVFSTELCDDVDTNMEVNKSKPLRKYKNQLMLSEWMVEVPPDLEEQWLMIPSPVGKRTLVVASSGNTASYSKSGFCLNKFPSALPGGCRKQRQSGNHGNTILDCIFDELAKTFYVLDVICWNGHPVLDSETDFRAFWLRSKMSETDVYCTTTSTNPYKFNAVCCYGCQKTKLEQGFNDQHPFEVDGFLFYHKQAHYLCGNTPLVVWLKPYMIPEVLGVNVPNKFIENIPSSYSGFAQHRDILCNDKEKIRKHQELYRKNCENCDMVSVELSSSSTEYLEDPFPTI